MPQSDMTKAVDCESDLQPFFLITPDSGILPTARDRMLHTVGVLFKPHAGSTTLEFLEI